MFEFEGFALPPLLSGGIGGGFGGNDGVSRVMDDGVVKRLRAALPLFTTAIVASVANPRRLVLLSTPIHPGRFQPDDAESFDVSTKAVGFQHLAALLLGDAMVAFDMCFIEGRGTRLLPASITSRRYNYLLVL